MRRMAIAVAVLVLAACGDDPAPAGPQLGDSVRLARGAVDSRLTTQVMTDPYDAAPVIAPRGTRYVAVSLSWIDEGRRPFPRGWARFTLVDGAGHRTTGAVLTPLRRTHPDRPRRGQELTQIVALPLGDGRRPARLELGSIVARWRFAASWRLS